MVNHKNLSSGDFWAPPGGGVEMNETAHETLKREFREETSMTVNVGDLLFVTEYYREPLHAVELFFRVDYVAGEVKKGYDPEMNAAGQIITDTRFLTWKEIAETDPKHLHGVFKYVVEPAKIIDLRGYFKL